MNATADREACLDLSWFVHGAGGSGVLGSRWKLHAAPCLSQSPKGARWLTFSSVFEEFFQDHHARLFAALCLTTGSLDESEEMMQDAFLKIWER